jgi:hypothetical protein
MPRFRVRVKAKPVEMPPGMPRPKAPAHGLFTFPETVAYYRRAGLAFQIGQELEADVDELQLEQLRADPRVEVLETTEVIA